MDINHNPKDYQKHIGEKSALADPVNHQDQPATIIAAHYSGARQAINEWIRRRDQYMVLYITAVGAIAAYYINKTCNIHLLTVIPVITTLVIISYNSADIHIGYLSKWLQYEYSEMLDEYSDIFKTIRLSRSHWDSSDALDEFYTSTAAAWRYFSLGSIFVVPNLITLYLCFSCGVGNSIIPASASTTAATFSCYCVRRIYVNRRDMVVRRRTKPPIDANTQILETNND